MSVTRRDLLQAVSAFTAGLALPATAHLSRPRKYRVVLMTDTHLPADGQNARVAKCVAKVRRERPDLILFGGDNVMAVDPSSVSEEAADRQFENFRQQVMQPLRSLPMLSVVGNHCIFRGDKSKAIRAYEMPHRYFAKDMGDWRFLMLDTFHPDGCKVDDEQFVWLKEQVATPKPVFILSHAPLLTVSVLIDAGANKDGGYSVPSHNQVANSVALRDLFLAHPNVRIAASGHMHHVDRCDYDHVSYVCGGAVSGGWWGNDYFKFGPAYVVFDLNPDGSFSHRVEFWEKDARTAR